MHQVCFLYMLNYPVMSTLSERESTSKHARKYVYLSTIEKSSYFSKIEKSSDRQKLVSHPMPEHVDELISLDAFVMFAHSLSPSFLVLSE